MAKIGRRPLATNLRDNLGLLSFSFYNKADKAIILVKARDGRLLALFLFGPMFELEQQLLATYRNQTIQVVDLYAEQHWGRTLTKNNYIDALLNLEKKGQIKITRKRTPRDRSLPKGYLPDKNFLSFKPQKS